MVKIKKKKFVRGGSVKIKTKSNSNYSEENRISLQPNQISNESETLKEGSIQTLKIDKTNYNLEEIEAHVIEEISMLKHLDSLILQKNSSPCHEKASCFKENASAKLENSSYEVEENEKLCKSTQDEYICKDDGEIDKILNSSKGFRNNFSLYFKTEIHEDFQSNIENLVKITSEKQNLLEMPKEDFSYNSSRIKELLKSHEGWIQKALLKGDIIFEDNFWSEAGYLGVCRRLEESNEFMEDMITAFDKRNRIEEQYSKEILEWTNILSDAVGKHLYPNTDFFLYGDIHQIFETFVNLEMHKAREHTNLWKTIDDDIARQLICLYNTQCMNFSGKKTNQPRELQNMFNIPRKEWAKLESKLAKAKRQYKVAFNKHQKLQNRKIQALRKEALSTKEPRKTEEFNLAKHKYVRIIKKMNRRLGAFKEKMTDIFSKYSELEVERLQFFKMALEKYHKFSNYFENKTFCNLNEKLTKTISEFDPHKTMESWSRSYGPMQPLDKLNLDECIKHEIDDTQ